jgi:hypothetical protein
MCIDPTRFLGVKKHVISVVWKHSVSKSHSVSGIAANQNIIRIFVLLSWNLLVSLKICSTLLVAAIRIVLKSHSALLMSHSCESETRLNYTLLVEMLLERVKITFCVSKLHSCVLKLCWNHTIEFIITYDFQIFACRIFVSFWLFLLLVRKSDESKR